MLNPGTLWLAREPADMRAGIDTLTQKVRAQLRQSPHGGAAFVFTNRARTRIKVLLWDGNGVWLCTRRLHRGLFTWPCDGDDVWPVTPEQFAWLSAGVDWQRLTERPAETWRGRRHHYGARQIHEMPGACHAPGMKTDALYTKQGPDKLREIAISLLTAHERRISELEEARELARQARFGRKGEAFTGEQRQLAEEDTAADRAGITRQLRGLLPERDAPKAKPMRTALPAYLPREETTLEPDSTTACPGCGGELRHIRDEVSEKLEYVPARFVVLKTVRPKSGGACCDTVHSAALPPSVIENGHPGPGLLAQVVISKTCDHLPLYRLQKIFAREGMSIPASTLSDWSGEVGAALAPLAAALRRDLVIRQVLHADEPPLTILDAQKGKAKSGYLWAYASATGSERDVVVYDCCAGAAGRMPVRC